MPLKSLGNFGRTCPLITAFLCTASGIYIFGNIPPEVKEGNGVKAASVFRSALLVLLWKIKVYPRSLKKLSKFMQYVIEFLLAMYIIEYFQIEFWVPLERSIKKGLTKLPTFAEEHLQSFGVDVGEYVEILSNEWTGCFVVYAVSLFFFISVLHATKLIDLRDTKYGPEPFIYAIMQAYHKFQEMMQSNNKRAIMYHKSRQDKYMIKGGSARDTNHKSIGWKKGPNNRNQKEIEWSRDDDYVPFDDDYSDFEMDIN